VRYVYCERCGRVSTKARTERDLCVYCGSSAERIALARPWQSYLSSAIVVIAVGILLFGPIVDGLQRTLVAFAAIAAAFALSAWSLRVSKARVLRTIELRKASGEGKA